MISDIIPQNGEFEAVFFFFEEGLISQFLQSQENRHQEAPQEVPGFLFRYTSEIRHFTEACLQIYANKSTPSKAITKLKLQELLYLISNSEQGIHFIQLLFSLQNKKKRNLHEFMLLNFDKPLAIADYAFLTGRSVSTFRRDFLRQFDISPKPWLIAKRMEKAKELLLNGQNSITEVSLAVGYDNLSHFIHAFRKSYNLSPKQFLIQYRMETKL